MTDRCDQCLSPIPRLEAPAIHLEGWPRAGGSVWYTHFWVCSFECKKARQVRASLETPRIYGLDDWINNGPKWDERVDYVVEKLMTW